MSTLSGTVRDSRTMLRRNLRHMLRYPAMSGMIVAFPVIFLLLFVYVFGGTLGAGLPGGGGRAAYVNYVTPGILLFAIATAATGIAVGVAVDMTSGIIARLRTMAISRASVLTGHVLGSMIQTMLGMVLLIGVALLIGFRPVASSLEWLAAAGLLALVTLAVTWLSVALGLAAKTAESASNTPMPLMLLPFLGSGFVPTASMPEGLRWFAEYQPFTPVIDTIRGLLLGGAIGGHATVAIAWSAGIALASYLWARRLYDRDPVPS
jgi:ABC-2 type transport system permease protein